MKRTGAQAAETERLEKDGATEEHIGELKLAIEKIEDRASTRTEVLVTILRQQEEPNSRHWGINE